MAADSLRKRPWRVTIFSALVLLLGSGLNVARAFWAWRQAEILSELSLRTALPMDWLAVTSLVWGLIFGLCSVGLWSLQAWGRWVTLGAVTAFHVHIWVNHMLYDRSEYARQVWPFAVVHSVIVLIVVWVFLNWPSIRSLYRRSERRAPEEEVE